MCAGRRFGARPAVELREHVAHVHLDGALAEHELRRDLGVRAPDRDVTQDLELASGKPATLELGGGAPAQPPVDGFPERFECRRRAPRERRRAQPPEGAVRAHEQVDARLPVACGDEHRPRPQLGQGDVEGPAELLEQLERLRELRRRLLERAG